VSLSRGRTPAVLAVVLSLAILLSQAAPALAQLSDADVYVAQATLDIEDKKWDDALAQLKIALSKEPEHIEALYYTGVAYMGKRQPAEALKYLLQARAKAPDDTSIAYQLGLAYFALEQYAQAQPLLEQAFDKDPTLDGLGYYVGYLRYRAGKYQDSLKAFRAARTADPTLADLTKLYAGLALKELGLSSQAEAEIAQIGQLQPASPLTGPAERLKSALAASEKKEKRFRAEVKLGGFYDDNAGAEPNQKSHDSAVQLARQNNRRTFGTLESVTGEYDWLKTNAWTGTGSLQFFGTHNYTLGSFDIDDYIAAVRMVHRGTVMDLPIQTGGSFTYDYLTLGYRELVQRYSVSSYAALVENAQNLTSFQGRIEIKEYNEKRPLPTEEFQDAVNYMVGFLHFVRFDRDRHFVKGGFQYDTDVTGRGGDFEYRGYRFVAGGQYTLPWRDVRLTYDFDLHYRNYLHRNAFLPADDPGERQRTDQEYTNTVRAEVPLPWFWKDQNFFVTGEYTNKVVDSNINSFSYVRNYGAIYFTWQY
jgi:tetratricopeptide (TPR) repeat protein